jgi:N-acetylneuraminate lyase
MRTPKCSRSKVHEFDLFKVWEIRRAGAVVFNGSDEMLVAGLIMGANGGIGSIYNLVPEQFVSLCMCAAAGMWKQARQIQDAINELISVILNYPVNPALKAILVWSGIDCGPCIAPRRRLTPSEEALSALMLVLAALWLWTLPVPGARLSAEQAAVQQKV